MGEVCICAQEHLACAQNQTWHCAVVRKRAGGDPAPLQTAYGSITMPVCFHFFPFGVSLPLLPPSPPASLLNLPPLALQSPPQLDGAFEFLKKLGPETLDGAAFEEAAGVGVVVSDVARFKGLM